ncbi:putative transcriptional regulatory protein [Cyphellophora attinorum]|uniref:Putative transcriptional regulatory protein n=1 Tax=Cyphellophora attinorum TaxID=1664694 RepID=A0A0N1H4Q9_9EURO|nr:putative transcriptional regulatory protein [Phialophora attinorum]KPI35775.1 putative transcriptional regulatory protein [Phialophora attinorum]
MTENLAMATVISLTSHNRRLDRLETTVAALVQRLDAETGQHRDTARNGDDAGDSKYPSRRPSSPPADSAPVFMIRDAATGIGLESPSATQATPAHSHGVLELAGISRQDALSMVSMFAYHYGRWVRFDESANPEHLLADLQNTPLLLCSVLLIAVRHISSTSATTSASVLLNEAQSLLASSLLGVAADLSFFRSALILSLWSTTVGQAPLTMDGWLLTAYALQQASVSSVFGSFTRKAPTYLDGDELDAWYIWNHLCLAHLQYCIGMQRKPAIAYTQIKQHVRLFDKIQSSLRTNFEERMLAEIELYWIIYDQSSSRTTDRREAERTLQNWRKEWTALFQQPRSQFLVMGDHFALLLLASRSKSRIANDDEALSELVRLSTSILNLFLNTDDDRIQHLTDHIYHIFTFAAITLCRLLEAHEARLRKSHDVASLDSLVSRLVLWLKSVGPKSHVAHMLGSVVASEQKRLRPESQPTPIGSIASVESLQYDSTLMFPDFFEAFDMDAESMWPTWDVGHIE